MRTSGALRDKREIRKRTVFAMSKHFSAFPLGFFAYLCVLCVERAFLRVSVLN
jgi:hypothetical protein